MDPGRRSVGRTDRESPLEDVQKNNKQNRTPYKEIHQ
jgi:hypothetical protein